MSRSMVMIELAGDAPLPRDLAAGGVFVPDCALRLAEECDLVVCGASHQLTIPARVVYVDPRGGAGLELLGFSPEMKAQLVELATLASGSGERPAPLLDDDPPPEPAAVEAPADDLQVPGWDGALEVEAPAGIPHARPDEAAGDGDDDLAIPLSDEEVDAAAIVAEPIARPGDAVFAYAKPGLAYRGGVARRAEAGGDSDSDGDGDGDGDLAAALGAELDAELGIGDFADAEPDAPGAPEDDQALELDLIGLVGDAPEADAPEADEPGDEVEGEEAAGAPGANGRSETGARARPARNVNERLRGLTLVAQVKMATQGELHERIILERLYGKNVWEALLRNHRLTAPEVARIARYGALPRVLMRGES